METLLYAVDRILWFFWLAIIGRSLLSWVVPMIKGRPHPILISAIRILNQITEPILAPIRRVLPTFGTMDLSPMAALLLIWLMQTVISTKL